MYTELPLIRVHMCVIYTAKRQTYKLLTIVHNCFDTFDNCRKPVESVLKVSYQQVVNNCSKCSKLFRHCRKLFQHYQHCRKRVETPRLLRACADIENFGVRTTGFFITAADKQTAHPPINERWVVFYCVNVTRSRVLFQRHVHSHE